MRATYEVHEGDVLLLLTQDYDKAIALVKERVEAGKDTSVNFIPHLECNRRD